MKFHPQINKNIPNFAKEQEAFKKKIEQQKTKKSAIKPIPFSFNKVAASNKPKEIFKVEEEKPTQAPPTQKVLDQ